MTKAHVWRRDRSEGRREGVRGEGSGRGFCLMGCFCFMQHLALHNLIIMEKLQGAAAMKLCQTDMGLPSCYFNYSVKFVVIRNDDIVTALS